MRWVVEEYFHTIKTAGFNIEQADIAEPEVMIKLVAAIAVAAVTVMQLVKGRDGTTDQSLLEVFEPADQPILEAVSARQAKPHANRTRIRRDRSPSPRGSSLVSAAGPVTMTNLVQKPCAGVSTTSSASNTARP